MARVWIHTEMMSMWSCMGTKKCVVVGPLRERVVPSYITDRHLRDKSLLCNRSCLLHTRLVVPKVCSVPPPPLITPLHASVELAGTRSRSLHAHSLQHSSPTHWQREGSSPTQPWKGGGWVSSSPLTKAFASLKPLPIPPPYPSICAPYPPGARS